MIDQAVRDAERRKLADEAFAKWLGDPLTRMALSTIPPGEHQEALRMLLRSAFDAGIGVGVGTTMLTVVDAILAPKRPNP